MRKFLNEDFIEMLPEGLRFNIAIVKKLTNNTGYLGVNDASAVSATEDQLWLFSMPEVYGSFSHQRGPLGIFASGPNYHAVYDAEGSQYMLYANRGVSVKSYGSCKKAGADSWWWLRSPHVGHLEYFRIVRSDGYWRVCRGDDARGVSPGFCF